VDLIPMVLEKNWQRMERLATRSFGALRELEDELLGFFPPSAEWARCRAERDKLFRAETGASLEGQAAYAALQARQIPPGRATEIIIPIDETLHINPTVVLNHWQMALKGQGTAPRLMPPSWEAYRKNHFWCFSDGRCGRGFSYTVVRKTLRAEAGLLSTT